MDKLVVLRGSDLLGVRSRIDAKSHVKQEASARVLVLEGDASSVEAITASPEVSSFEELAADPEGFASLELTPSEEMFIEAWNQGQSMQKKDRVGEGLTWDHEGFEAP
ncbi:MAG: hypothetical protein H0T75_05930 [Rhizobiales bacterium]|nr:hypothetical protein [Hyphomicrobiales bacterium]